MDAIKFIKEENRMCSSFNHCTGCPAYDVIQFCKMNITNCDAEEKLSIVEKWSKEHPAKTRQSVFLEQYPEARIDEADGVLNVCPAILSMAHRGDGVGCVDMSKECDVFCREFWMQEVE